MADRYVSTSGSNANAGTIGAPWRDIDYAVARTFAGDTLWVRDGTYTGPSACIDSQSHTVNSGSSFSNAVTIAGYPGETAILQPPQLVSAVRLTTGAPSYIIVKDLIFDMVNCTLAGGESGADGIYLGNGAHHNRFLRLEVKNCGANGVQFGASNGNSPFNEVLYCRIHTNGQSMHDRGMGPGVNNGYGLYIATSDNLFEGNEVYDNGGYGFHLYDNVGPMFINRNVIRKNRIHDNGTHGGSNAGLVQAWGADNEISNNLIYRNRQGVLIYSSSSNALVANNDIYDNVGDGITGQFYSSGPTIRNNAVWGNGGTQINDIGGTATIDHNVTADPGVVNAGAGDFHLLVTSTTAINAGSTIAGIAGDFDGGARPNGASFDIGAYEFGSTPGTVSEPGLDPTGGGGGGPTPPPAGPTVPAATLVFTGFGDSSTMRFVSPLGVIGSQPASSPVPGSGVDGIVSLKPSGRYAVIGANAPNFGTTGIGTFDATFRFHAEAGTGGVGRGAARDDTGHFYGGGGSGANGQIIRYDTDAANRTVYGPIPATGTGTTPRVVGVGVNGAGTIAYYYVFGNNPAPNAVEVDVEAWDLSGNAYLGVFANNGAGWHPSGIISLTNGEVIVGWKKTATGGVVKHYNAAGATLHTYTLAGTRATPIWLTHGLDETTFWVNYYNDDVATSSGVTVSEITISTGAIVHTWEPEDGGFEFDSSFTVMRLAIVGESTTAPTPTIPTSVPCCGSSPGGSNPGPILPPTGPGWIPVCVGAGAVEIATDLSNSESWAA